jgi:hypothetical protein
LHARPRNAPGKCLRDGGRFKSKPPASSSARPGTPRPESEYPACEENRRPSRSRSSSIGLPGSIAKASRKLQRLAVLFEARDDLLLMDALREVLQKQQEDVLRSRSESMMCPGVSAGANGRWEPWFEPLCHFCDDPVQTCWGVQCAGCPSPCACISSLHICVAMACCCVQQPAQAAMQA